MPTRNSRGYLERCGTTEGGRQTTHRVTAPERLGGGLELRDEDLSKVVRRSFEFLLEREPASSILSQFSLDDISRYFPEYEQELERRLGRDGAGRRGSQ